MISCVRQRHMVGTQQGYHCVRQRHWGSWVFKIRHPLLSWRHYGKVVTKNVMNKGESDQFQAMVGLVAVAPKGNGVDHLSYDPKLLTDTCDKLLSYSLHYKEIENGILGKGANPSAKGGGEDEDWARNATQDSFLNCENDELVYIILEELWRKAYNEPEVAKEVNVMLSSKEDLSSNEEIVLIGDIPFSDTLMKNYHKLLQLQDVTVKSS
ncbi:hypothetical protein Tco_0513970 [Tanacetum coccineum]